jgi:hypothetical protein
MRTCAAGCIRYQHLTIGSVQLLLLHTSSRILQHCTCRICGFFKRSAARSIDSDGNVIYFLRILRPHQKLTDELNSGSAVLGFDVVLGSIEGGGDGSHSPLEEYFLFLRWPFCIRFLYAPRTSLSSFLLLSSPRSSIHWRATASLMAATKCQCHLDEETVENYAADSLR